MAAVCFQCTVRPAGNEHGGPHSAYCADCQPRDMRPQIKGPQCRCGSCGLTFANLSTFDGHRRNYQCLDPKAIGLELRARVWGTPEGNANSDRKAALLAAAAKGLEN